MPVSHVQFGWSDHEGHATPLFHFFLMLFQLHHEMLRRLAVVAEVNVEHSGITRIVP